MRARTVAIVVFDGVQGLDVFGPADVFYFANFIAARRREARVPYDVQLVGREVGPVRTAAGPSLHVDVALDDPRLRPDLLLVAGGLRVDPLLDDAEFVAGLTALAERSAEVGSICTGAVLLAATGLLDGRRATTHWALADQLRSRFPAVRLEPDRIFVHDGVWSSAGVTAGIDLALEVLRQHHGTDVATETARNLVVYLRRAGGQQQFSAHLAAQGHDAPVFGNLLAHIADHPDDDLTVAALAARAGMSQRSFQRAFSRDVGTSPGRYVERVRVDAARRLLEQSDDSLDRVARRCGYGAVETFHRSFRRVMGVTPGEYRDRFRPPAPAPTPHA